MCECMDTFNFVDHVIVWMYDLGLCIKLYMYYAVLV